MDKLIALLILALLALAVLSILTGDTTLMNVFFTLFRAH